MVREEIYSPFLIHVYILCMSANKEQKRFFHFGRSCAEGYVYLYVILEVIFCDVFSYIITLLELSDTN